MIHTITLIILACLIIANLVVLINVSNNPMYNAMDKYNALDAYNDIEILENRLKALEDKFAYHIQSTDELKPKA